MAVEETRVIDRAAQQSAAHQQMGLSTAQPQETLEKEETNLMPEGPDGDVEDFFEEENTQEQEQEQHDEDLEEFLEEESTQTQVLGVDLDEAEGTVFTFEGKDYTPKDVKGIIAAATREGGFRNQIAGYEERAEAQNAQMETWANYVVGMENIVKEILAELPGSKPLTAAQVADAMEQGYTREQLENLDRQNLENQQRKQAIIQKLRNAKNNQPQLTQQEAQTATKNAISAAMRLGASDDGYYELADSKSARTQLNKLGKYLVSKGMTKEEVAILYANMQPANLGIFFDAMKWQNRGVGKKAVREPVRRAAAPSNFAKLSDQQLEQYADKKGYTGDQRLAFLNRLWTPADGQWNYQKFMGRLSRG